MKPNMDIEAFGKPSPGQPFNFTVRGGVGRVTIEAYVGQDQIFKTECPDPPCHEMVLVPGYASGQLLVVATDSRGVSKQTAFAIETLLSGGMVSLT
jgi:hypothetical protein